MLLLSFAVVLRSASAQRFPASPSLNFAFHRRCSAAAYQRHTLLCIRITDLRIASAARLFPLLALCSALLLPCISLRFPCVSQLCFAFAMHVSSPLPRRLSVRCVAPAMPRASPPCQRRTLRFVSAADLFSSVLFPCFFMPWHCFSPPYQRETLHFVSAADLFSSCQCLRLSSQRLACAPQSWSLLLMTAAVLLYAAPLRRCRASQRGSVLLLIVSLLFCRQSVLINAFSLLRFSPPLLKTAVRRRPPR